VPDMSYAWIFMAEKLVTIKTYIYPLHAYADRALLEAERMQSCVIDDGIVYLNWLYSTAVGGVKLKVRESEVDMALTYINFPGKETPNTPSTGEDGCPKCHSTHIHFERLYVKPFWLLYLALDILLGAGFPILVFKNKWKCNNCGYQWKDKRKKSE